MMLRVGIGIAVAVLTVASAVNNWEHMSKFGMGVCILVVAAEMLKPLLPIALAEHSRDMNYGAWVGTLGLWCMIVLFSFVNTFSAALTRQATEIARQGTIKSSETRPEHIILRELASVRTCKPIRVTIGKGKRAEVVEKEDAACLQDAAAKKLALTAELTTHKARTAVGHDVAIDAHTVTDGQTTLANMLGWNPNRWHVQIWTVLLWVLVCELGSALGGLCIPRGARGK
jgi:hypothetical protein